LDKVVSIHQPEHLPWLGYFHKMAACDLYVILDSVQFEKHYFQNRNKIKDANSPAGWTWITVPVRTRQRSDQLICEVTIQNEIRTWRSKSFRTIQQNYGRAPHFGSMQPFLQETYEERSWDRLIDLNLHLIEYFRKVLEIQTPTIRSSELGIKTSRTQLLLDICRATEASTYLSGPSGRDYLEVEQFRRAGINVVFHEFVHPVYDQGGDRFISHLSTIDLVANYGPESRGVLLGG